MSDNESAVIQSGETVKKRGRPTKSGGAAVVKPAPTLDENGEPRKRGRPAAQRGDQSSSPDRKEEEDEREGGVKRGRGRPPKSPGTHVKQQPKVPSGRGRGRPPKKHVEGRGRPAGKVANPPQKKASQDENGQQHAKDNSDQDETESNDNDSSYEQTASPKRKSPTKVATSSASAAAAAKESENEEVVVKTGGGRGRPPKPASSKQPESSKPVTLDQNGEPRKRGRPTTKVLEEINNQSPVSSPTEQNDEADSPAKQVPKLKAKIVSSGSMSKKTTTGKNDENHLTAEGEEDEENESDRNLAKKRKAAASN